MLNRGALALAAVAGLAAGVVAQDAVTASVSASGSASGSTVGAARRGVAGFRPDALVAVAEAGRTTAVMNTGEVVELDVQQVWKPVCGTTAGALDAPALAAIADAHNAAFAGEDAEVTVVNSLRGTAMCSVPQINVVYNVTGTIPNGALASFQRAEAYLESLFGDPITITVNVSFSNLGGGVLGATSSNYVTAQTWANARTGLINGMDAGDTLQTSLPSGTTIPVRYDGTTATVTNENRVFFTVANFNATLGSTPTIAANMSYNSAFAWDFDPTNGVVGSQFSLTDVVIHETGHAMGFVSGTDFRTGDIEAIDIIRFQRTDGTGDFNPDTTAEFGTTPRTVSFNTPNDDANSDLITVEYRMSDGDPNQASHFREQGTNIGLMDPQIANGQTFVSRTGGFSYFAASDLNVFDFVGYDYPVQAASNPLTLVGIFAPTTLVENQATNISIAANLSSDTLSGTPQLFFRVGTSGNFTAVELVPGNPAGTFTAAIPAQPCDTTVQYFAAFPSCAAMADVTFPAGAPTNVITATTPACPPPNCPADFNGDTTPGDIFDLFDFLSALDGGLDFNNDTSPADIFDLFDFLAVLDQGCP